MVTSRLLFHSGSERWRQQRRHCFALQQIHLSGALQLPRMAAVGNATAKSEAVGQRLFLAVHKKVPERAICAIGSMAFPIEGVPPQLIFFKI